jgi:hypothetical protein
MAKCYIISCVACHRLHEVCRRDALTCSTRCRVWLSRHPKRLQEFRDICKRLEVTPISVLMTKAQIRLRPDLGERIGTGELSIESAQNLMADAFHHLVAKIAKAEIGANKAKGGSN